MDKRKQMEERIIKIDTESDYFCENKDTCVVVSVFNPGNFKSLVYNANFVIDRLRKSKIPTIVTELVYNKEKKSELNYTTKTFSSNSVIFSKENLWNLALDLIPENFSKIIFLDADINFTDLAWFDKSSDLLDKYETIQPMEYCTQYLPKITEEIDITKCKKSLALGNIIEDKIEDIKTSKYHPGYCIGVQRNFLEDIGRFFDLAIVGGGDQLFWDSIEKTKTNKLSYLREDLIKEYIEHKIKVKNTIRKKYPNNKINFVKDNVALHMFHGSIENRAYGVRYNLLNKNNLYNYFYNEQGVLEVKEEPGIKQYFLNRKDDG
jgi:hypothetical protein